MNVVLLLQGGMLSESAAEDHSSRLLLPPCTPGKGLNEQELLGSDSGEPSRTGNMGAFQHAQKGR